MSHEIFFPVPPTITNITATRCIDYSSGLEGVFDINVNAPHRSLSLAKVSGQDVAYCIYSLEKKRIKIERLTVRPTFRRQGIATDIVNAIAERYTPCTVKTMPELMLQYRAASMFANVHVPEIALGMQTDDEARDSAAPKQTSRSFDSLVVDATANEKSDVIDVEIE